MTIDDEYGHPVETGGDFARPEKLSGHLLLIYPIGYVQHIQTRFSQPGKRSDAICCDIVDLDEQDEFTHQPGKVYRSSNLMQAQLIVGLRPFIGKKVLGLITRGVARNGMNPPWIVTDMSGDPKCVEVARAWALANPDFVTSTFSPTPVPEQQSALPGRPMYELQPQEHEYQPQPRPQYQPPAAPQSAPVQGAGQWLPSQPPAPARIESPTLASMGPPPPPQGQQYTTEELEYLQALRAERDRRERAAQAQHGDNPPF